jgi:hypothetical protein
MSNPNMCMIIMLPALSKFLIDEITILYNLFIRAFKWLSGVCVFIVPC